ncbi:hypothetical protein [Vreelandella titanicae]|uniref:hypothetical protein n=1 Tax=Vreelandella titanicae TaxID=664683 RepID=UPI003FD7084C
MNKWQQLEEQLSGIFGTAKILADGYEVSFYRVLNAQEKLVVVTYVNGWMEGKWFSADENGEPKHPESRFFRPRKSRACKLKQYPNLKRIFGKKEADKMTALRTTMFDPYWNSPKTLISHLKKHFPDLELKDDEVAS